MSGSLLMLFAVAIVAVAYRTYGTWIAHALGVDASRPTPAVTSADGVDYVASPAPMVLGHHFASIAGAGPIVGPIVAVAFGWLPALLWVLVGIVFIGGTNDLGSTVASLRHDGRTIGDVIERYVGTLAKRMLSVFAIAALVLVIAVLVDIVARTFAGNGAVESTSGAFALLAMGFGVVHRRSGLPLWLTSLIGIAGVVGCMVLGAGMPMTLSYGALVGVLLAYIFFAAVSPVWLLLQPRDYLNAFLLYAMVLGGIAGLFVAQPKMTLPAFVGWSYPNLGFLFPVLFITVACGAVSGFHSIIASGTTSKQLASEGHAKPIAYGSMLLEGLLAVLAIIAVSQLDLAGYRAALSDGSPITMFASGVAGFLTTLGVPLQTGVTFISLTVAAFALTSLDTCTRLGRYLIEELWAGSVSASPTTIAARRYGGTLVMIGAGGALCLSGQFSQVWPVFGAANQLIAAIALLAVGTWLAHAGRRTAFVLVTAAFMFAVTLAALGQLVWIHMGVGGSRLLAGVAAALLVMALAVLQQALPATRAQRAVSPSTSV